MADHAIQIDGREGDGIDVALYYSADSPDALLLAYSDARTGDGFLAVVPADHAADAMAHPNVYRRSPLVTADSGEGCDMGPLDPAVFGEHYVAEFGEMFAPLPMVAFPTDLLVLAESYGWNIQS